uniref:NADH dehydrogenase [ubiquinone] flavoprotein 3, mitochondrial n=1 Tax=Strix occidentalis caurina TaxID=311401 RepID=A0A8D0F7W6_STROC
MSWLLSGSPRALEIIFVLLRSFAFRGALQVLRLEARGRRGALPSAALCTRPAGSGTPPTKTTAAAEPPPEEFDNSTYKNLQHHEYNIYTFVDSVAALSKFRQPQPSSGRPSPRH